MSTPNPPTPDQNLTLLLAKVEGGDDSSLRHLMSAVYGQLRAMADDQLRRERAGHTLQATALVHEAFLKLVGQENQSFSGRAHFFTAAGQAMRRILVDHARTRGRDKRGGQAPNPRVPLSEVADTLSIDDADLMALDEALSRLAATDADAARVVELRFFAGLSVEEIAAILQITDRTVRRRWNYARGWLYREMGGKSKGPD